MKTYLLSVIILITFMQSVSQASEAKQEGELADDKQVISGESSVGSTLLAELGRPNKEPSTTDTLQYLWYPDEEGIVGAEEQTYPLTKDDADHDASETSERDLSANHFFGGVNLGGSYSTSSCPDGKSNCDDTSFIYGGGVGYETENFIYDVGFNYYTPKYRKDFGYSSNGIQEFVVAARYKIFTVQDWNINVGLGISHWTSLRTGSSEDGIETASSSGVSGLVSAGFNYRWSSGWEFVSSLSARKSFAATDNVEITPLVGVRYNFPSKNVNHNRFVTVVKNTQITLDRSNSGSFAQIYFDQASDMPDNSELTRLDNAVQSHNYECAIIIGHASPEGQADYNALLSKHRVDNLEKHFNSEYSNITIIRKYYNGEDFPYYQDNKKNRRVEILLFTDTEYCKK